MSPFKVSSEHLNFKMPGICSTGVPKYSQI